MNSIAWQLLGVAAALVLISVGLKRLDDRREREPWPVIDEWEEHCRTTPGMTDRALETVDLAMWETEGDWPEVYRAEDFMGDES